MNVIYYEMRNSYNVDSAFVIFMAWSTMIIRAVVARIVILLTALGYHIMETKIDQYIVNIAIMAFLYAISLAVELLVVNYLAVEYQLQQSTVYIAEAPHLICDIILVMWILLAFRRTLLVLIRKKEARKSVTVMKLFITYIAAMFTMAIVKATHLFHKKDSDSNWRAMVWLNESYMFIFLIMMSIILFVLRPQNPDCKETFNYFHELIADEEETVEDIEVSPRRKQVGQNNLQSSQVFTTEMTEIENDDD